MLANIPLRPNRLTEKKDEDYHVRYARWAIGNFNLYSHQSFVSRYLTNVSFYKGYQWIFDEDLDGFLMDETGNVRNRIKWVSNIVKPFVEYLRGSAIKMDMSAEVVSVSRESKNRRDKALDAMLYWTRAAQKAKGNPQLQQQIQQQYGVGLSEEETSATFNNLYIDEYTRNMNHLMKYISEVKNDMPSLKGKFAEDLALGGIAIPREIARNEEQVWGRVAPERFIFDMSCEYADLRDAEFMGEFEMLSATDIFEEHQNLDESERLVIENSSMSNIIGLHNIISFYTNYAQKLPTYRMCWRDIELNKHGIFYDEYGYPILKEINDQNPLNELIPVKDLEQFVDDYEWIRTVVNKGSKNITKNVQIVPTDSCRFCDFIPGEFINGGSSGVMQNLVLNYGIRPYSQKYSYRHQWIDYPYKPHTYSYILGEVISPVDCLISPQRYINRVLSVAESHVNNSRGSGTIIDKDVVDPQDGEEGIQTNMNNSKTVFVRAQRQLNNAVGSYDATIKQGTTVLYDIADRMKQVANENFGGGQALTGNVDPYRASTGQADQNITQAVAMQEPFFFAIEKMYMSCYNSMVNRGKRIYAANQRQLALEVGDDGVIIFKMSKEYELEDFKCTIRRSPDFYSERDAANQMLMTFLQGQLIDQQTFAKYFNNSTVQEAVYGLREYTGLKVEMQKQQQQQAPAVQQATMQQQAAASELQHNQQSELVDSQNQGKMALQQSKNNTELMKTAMMAAVAKRGQDKTIAK